MKVVTRRQRRVAELIHEELGLLLERRISDPRLTGVTITDVEITPDLKLATVYFSVLDDAPARVELALAGLEHARGFFRKSLAEMLYLRFVPELRFRWDQSIRKGERIDRLLASLREGSQEAEE